MTLGFKQYFPWHTKDNPAPTYFREKILAGVNHVWAQSKHGFEAIESVDAARSFLFNRRVSSKIHTIRESNRWKAGMKMHMAYGVRTKAYQQFNRHVSGLQIVKSVQEIEIIWDQIDLTVKIDGRKIECDEVDRLWQNDGFNAFIEFARWFREDFKGQIIHWTDLKY